MIQFMFADWLIMRMHDGGIVSHKFSVDFKKESELSNQII